MVSSDCKDDTEINIGASTDEMADYFGYLDSSITSNISCNKNCQLSISKANSVFERNVEYTKLYSVSLSYISRLSNTIQRITRACLHIYITQSSDDNTHKNYRLSIRLYNSMYS